MLPGMPVEVPAAREIVPNVNRLAAATRAAGGKVVWVKMCLEGQSDAAGPPGDHAHFALHLLRHSFLPFAGREPNTAADWHNGDRVGVTRVL